MPRKPRIEVTERNIQTGLETLLESDPRYKARLSNPFNAPSVPIRLKDDTRECRWFNSAIASDHTWRAKQKGWDPVRVEDVVEIEQIGGFTKSPDGFVTRGERGQEVLMSMPKQVRKLVQIAKTRKNQELMGNPSKMKADVVSAAGDRFGSEAADYVQTHVDVKDSYETVQRTDAVE